MRNADQPDSIANPVEVCLSPDLGVALGTLSETIERFVANESIAGEIPFRLSLALDELVTNSVNYALPDVAEPMLRIRLARDASGVVAQVEDNGAAFNPFQDAPKPEISQELDARPVGGLGIFLATQFVDSTNYERAGGVNRITLRMKLEK